MYIYIIMCFGRYYGSDPSENKVEKQKSVSLIDLFKASVCYT